VEGEGEGEGAASVCRWGDSEGVLDNGLEGGVDGDRVLWVVGLEGVVKAQARDGCMIEEAVLSNGYRIMPT
jgi:hypothetical protein